MRSRPRLATVLAVLAGPALLAGVAGCGGDDGAESAAAPGDGATNLVSGGEPTPGGRLVIGLEAETDGWSPSDSQIANAGYLVASAVYDPLLTTGADGEPEPFLAESVTPNDDHTVWTITLRDGVVFHDGSEVDATDVAAGIEASRTGLTSSFAMGPVEQVEVVDDLTVRVSLNEPWASYDSTLTTQSGFVVPAELAGTPELAQEPVGTGPFRMVEWEPGDRVLVERNEDYWREGLPHLDSIEYRVISDAGTRSAALEAGDVDLIQTTSDEDILRFRLSDLTQVEDLDSEETFVMLNQAAAPFDDPIAREAIALATDSRRIIETVGSGVAEPTTGPFAPDEPWHSEDTGYPDPDPERAAELVAQYEAETGEAFEVRLSGTADVDTLGLQQLLQSMWEEAGIDVTIGTVEQSQFVLDIANGDYQAAWFRNFGYADPDFNYLFWHSSTSEPVGEVALNFTRTEDAELDAALEAGRASGDEAARAEAYQQAVRALNGQLAYVWLGHTPWALVARPGVRGLEHPLELGIARLDAKPWVGELWIEG